MLFQRKSQVVKRSLALSAFLFASNWKDPARWAGSLCALNLLTFKAGQRLSRILIDTVANTSVYGFVNP